MIARRSPQPPSVARALTLAAVLILGQVDPVRAQTAHYWGDHFGNESVLLSGAVIGSVTDAGAVFYNPARLVLQEDPTLVASAKLYEWTTVQVRDGLGEGEDLKRSRFGGAPSFLVGSFTISALEDHQFAYGALTRYRSRVGFSVRQEQDSAAAAPPDPDLFVGFKDFESEIDEDWFGLSWAYGPSHDLSLGVSLFYYDRNFRRRASVDYRAVDADGAGKTLQAARSYTLDDKGLVAKLGVAVRRDEISLGLTATLPYWSWSGKGSIQLDDFTVGRQDSTGVVDDDLRSTAQAGLPVDWTTPWSVGAGFGWTRGQWQLHLAAEYFAPIARHVVLQPDPSAGQSATGEPIDYIIVDERRGVLNSGGGVRWTVSGDFSAFASVVTNYSAAPDSVVEFTELESTVSHTSLAMDFLLFGGGVSVRTSWFDLTLGATWQGDREPTHRLGDPPLEVGTPDDLPTPMVGFDQWRFLVGISVPLLERRVGDDGG